MPPILGPGLVERTDLLDRLTRPAPAGVIAITAPAGYGKTTLLTQLVERWPGPTAWLTLSRFENDSASFLNRVGEALGRGGVMDDNALLVIDRIELLTKREARDALLETVDQLQGRMWVALSSRTSKNLSLPAIRARGQLHQFGQAELGMTGGEARALLENEGVPAEHMARIVDICEGWPAALYLMALADKDEPFPRHDPETDNKHLVEYLAVEVVRRLPRARHDFLTRTSILDQMNGSLCDAVLETTGSARTLEQLETSTHLVHAVDSSGTWYRTNRALQMALRTELARDDTGAVRDLHRRAADWYESHHLPLAALHHAREAGEVEQFARLLRQVIRTRYTSGDSAVVRGWMQWLEAEDVISQHPEIAAAGSLIYAIEGDALQAERWLDVATSTESPPPLAILVRAVGSRSGMQETIKDAVAAREGMAPGSEWLPTTYLIEGLGHMWNGDPESAEPLFIEAVTLGERAQSDLTVTIGLAERALIAINMGEWGRGEDLTKQALTRVDSAQLEGYSTSGLALVMGARVARHAGDMPAAETFLARASQIRPRLNSAIPGLAVQVATEMARAYAELSDIVGARALIRDATDVLLQRPDLGALPDQLEDLRIALRNLGPGTIGPSALTKAELRLLPYLATHLTFPEIGDRLFISRHTVKTQAMSIYRKLGTSSRSEAVAKAAESGLLNA